MEKDEIVQHLNEDSIICKFCSKEISLLINRKDQTISFKNHLKQKHGISIKDYFQIETCKICKFCKSEPAEIKITKNDNLEILIEELELCNSKICMTERKKLNCNSVEYVSIVFDVSSEEALEILHSRNKSPFYKSNFNSDEDYKNSQKKFSFRCKEFYENKINPKTGLSYTTEEITKEISAIQTKFGKKNRNPNSRNKTPDFVFRSTIDGFIEKFGDEIGKIKYENFKEKSIVGKKNSPNFKLIPYTLRWYQFVYGEIKGKISYEHRLKYKKFILMESYYKMVFGEKWFEIYDATINGEPAKFHRASKTACKFFSDLFLKIDFCDRKKDIWCAFNNKERCLKDFNKKYYYDFSYINENNKKIIEYNGDFWHANPMLYSAENVLSLRGFKKLASDIWKEDKKKIEMAKKYGYDVLVIWERDVLTKDGLEYNLEKCLNFLRG